MRTDRLNQMEAYILSRGTVSLYALAEHFDVSLNTIRRDVADLMERGHIRKVYGGVSVRHPQEAQPYSALLPIAKRAEMHKKQKNIIGELAAGLVEENSVIFLDTGSTVPYMLPYLVGKGVTIVTNSLNVMMEAAKHPDLKVLALGGMINYSTNTIIGEAMFGLRSIRFNALFMAATALSVEWGASNNTYEEYRLKSELMKLHTQIYMLADSSKFGKNATYCYCPFSQIRGIVTDRVPNPSFLKAMRDTSIQLYCPENTGEEEEKG